LHARAPQRTDPIRRAVQRTGSDLGAMLQNSGTFLHRLEKLYTVYKTRTGTNLTDWLVLSGEFWGRMGFPGQNPFREPAQTQLAQPDRVDRYRINLGKERRRSCP
jgi:hypothetical protein